MVTDVRKKGILLIASFLLLLAAGVYMAFAWYTKMTSASDMTFDAARWEYSANYAVDKFSIGVYTSPMYETSGDEFRAIVDGKAAPGTCGFAPVVLSAENSDAAIGYVLKVDKSTMSPEFRERIFFYQDTGLSEPVGTDWGGEGREGNVIIGTIPAGETVTINIYWKWVYDYDEALSRGEVTELTTAANADEFDAFDTKVGKNPERYEADMRAQILINGTQLNPEEASGQWIEMTPSGTGTGQGSTGGDADEDNQPPQVPEPYEGATRFWYDADTDTYGCVVGNRLLECDGGEWSESAVFADIEDCLATIGDPIYLPPFGVDDFWLDTATGKYRFMVETDGNYVVNVYIGSDGGWCFYGETDSPDYRQLQLMNN